MEEAVMTTHETKSRKTSAPRGATFAILGFAGLAAMEHVASGLAGLLCFPLKMALETLPTIVLTAWHILQPCAFGHIGLLGGLLQVSTSWQFVLTLTGA